MIEKKVLDKIASVLMYVGLIGAILSGIGYILAITILIKGFKVDSILHTSIFSIISAAIGLMIMTFLKVQGISWASSIKENQEIIKIYLSPKMKHKQKKLHGLSYYWVTSSIKDVLFKAASIGLSSIGVVYLVIKGTNDWSLMILGVVNLVLFLSLGMLSCSKAYNYYNNTYIPFIKELIYDFEKENKIKITSDLDMVKEECIDERHDNTLPTESNNILESDMGVRDVVSNVQDKDITNNSDDLDSISGRSDNTRNTSLNRFSIDN